MWRAFVEVSGGFLGAPMSDRKAHGLRSLALVVMIAVLTMILWISVAD
jgi:hypothetical protein